MITYRIADNSDIETVSKLFSKAFVNCGVERLEALLNERSHLVVAENSGIIVGATLGVIRDSANDLMPYGKGHVGDSLGIDGFAGSIKYIYVSPDNRVGGVGLALVDVLMRWFFNNEDVDGVLAEAWRYPNGKLPAASVLSKAGMEAVLEEKAFWGEEYAANDFFCEECGGSCECNAVLYVRLRD